MMQKIKVWDIFVRLFHWSLVLCIAANTLLTNPEKTLHHAIGYGVLALVTLRVIWGLIGARHARFSDFWPNWRAVVQHLVDIASARRHVHLGHSPLGALMIYNLLVTLVIIVASGHAQTTLTFFGVKWVTEVHETAVTWLELSILLHVAAVVFESRRLGINLARSMVTGVKEIPPQ